MDIIRTNAQGEQEIRTGLGWRKVLPPTTTNGALTTLPIIDVTDISHPDSSRRQALAKHICAAAADVGFFYVSGHSVGAESVTSIFAQARRFFHDLSLEEKMVFDTARHEHYYGYYPIVLDEKSPSGAKLNEGINYGYEPACDPDATDQQDENGENWWPSEDRLPGYQDEVKAYMGRMLRLSRDLLRMFALGLDLDEHALDHLATNPYSILKMAHYPGAVEGTSEPSAIRPHTDYELLTILLQKDGNASSLEVLSNTGQWLQAKPIPGTFVVNIGDSMAMLTNGLFVSTMHRVLNTSGQPRYSVPFFLGANQGAEIKALDKFVNAANPAKFQPITSGDYIRQSLQAVYSKPDVAIVTKTIEVSA